MNPFRDDDLAAVEAAREEAEARARCDAIERAVIRARQRLTAGMGAVLVGIVGPIVAGAVGLGAAAILLGHLVGPWAVLLVLPALAYSAWS